MKDRSSERWLLLILILLSVAMTVCTGAWGDLYNETDGQYGGAAKIMAQGGSWLVPDNDGIPRLVKPPLLYWAMAGSMKIFGVNEFATRLPGAVSFCALIVLIFFMGKRWGGPWRGFVAGVVLLTFLGIFTLGRIVMPEPMFCAFIAGALYCALRGTDNETYRRRWFLAFWACGSLASFCKGWHGLLYPLAIVGIMALFSKELRPRFKGLLSWQGGLLFLAINLPWYFYIESKFPGYFHNLIFTEQIGHVTGSDAPATQYTSVPRMQFLLLHLAWFFPWSILCWLGWFANRRQRVRPVSEERLLLFSWIGIILASVLLAGERQDYYAMTLWPAVALWISGKLDGNLRVGAISLAVLYAIGLIVLNLPIIQPAETSGAVTERVTAMSTVMNFDATVWKSLYATAWFALGGGFLFAVTAIFTKGRVAFAALVLSTICLDLGAINGTARVAPYFSLAQVSDHLKKSSTPDSQLVYDGNIDSASSLLFYTDQPVVLLDQDPNSDFIVRKFGIGRERYMTTPDLVEAWQAPRKILFVTESRRLPEWRTAFNDPTLHPAAQCGTQIVLENRP